MQILKLGLQRILSETVVIVIWRQENQNVKLLMDYCPKFKLQYDIFTDIHALKKWGNKTKCENSFLCYGFWILNYILYWIVKNFVINTVTHNKKN